MILLGVSGWCELDYKYKLHNIHYDRQRHSLSCIDGWMMSNSSTCSIAKLYAIVIDQAVCTWIGKEVQGNLPCKSQPCHPPHQLLIKCVGNGVNLTFI